MDLSKGWLHRLWRQWQWSVGAQLPGAQLTAGVGELGEGKAVMLATGGSHSMVVSHTMVVARWDAVGLRVRTVWPAGCGRQDQQAGGCGWGRRVFSGSRGC